MSNPKLSFISVRAEVFCVEVPAPIGSFLSSSLKTNRSVEAGQARGYVESFSCRLIATRPKNLFAQQLFAHHRFHLNGFWPLQYFTALLPTSFCCYQV